MARKLVVAAILAVLVLASAPGGAAQGKAACNDGKDNDGDGLIDLNDPGCESKGDKDESDGSSVRRAPACSDGVDNDGDGQTDHPADMGCGSLGDIDEFNIAPQAKYFHILDPVNTVNNFEIPIYTMPTEEPASSMRPSGSVHAARGFPPIVGGPTWDAEVGGAWDRPVQASAEHPAQEAAAFLSAEIWATTGPMVDPGWILLYWSEGHFCIPEALVCMGSATYGPLKLNHVAGTGTVLPGGGVVGGKFKSEPLPVGTCYESIGRCYFGTDFVEVVGWFGAGVVLYDGSAAPSCVMVNMQSC